MTTDGSVTGEVAKLPSRRQVAEWIVGSYSNHRTDWPECMEEDGLRMDFGLDFIILSFTVVRHSMFYSHINCYKSLQSFNYCGLPHGMKQFPQ